VSESEGEREASSLSTISLSLMHTCTLHIQNSISDGCREYFFFADHNGQLFLDDARMKNFTSCYKGRCSLSLSLFLSLSLSLPYAHTLVSYEPGLLSLSSSMAIF
jgi:hypothetical protein